MVNDSEYVMMATCKDHLVVNLSGPKKKTACETVFQFMAKINLI
jgi:hypothetical protein